jgi:hypothetical protein
VNITLARFVCLSGCVTYSNGDDKDESALAHGVG